MVRPQYVLRVIKGLGLSLKIGLVGAVLATGIAVLLSACSVVSQSFDRVIVYILDLTMSIPHMLLLIIISFLVGGDVKGVITALALTHWPSITRLLRSELMQIKNLEYIQISKNLGKGYLSASCSSLPSVDYASSIIKYFINVSSCTIT